jgi:archaetidylinositol phosphate synthase
VDFIMDPAARAFSKISPNLISSISLVLAALAGAMIFFSDRWDLLLVLAALVILLSGFFDALDGKVARLTGKASKKGDFIDHVFDRYADVFLVGAVAVSAWCNIYLGLLALVGVMLTSYMGTQAQAVGVGRHYGGVLGRADRMVLLMIAPALQYALLATGNSAISLGPFHLTILEMMMLWFAVVGNLTAVQRAYGTWKALR